jgi:flagellar biosynthetic protein FlhB
VSLGEWLGSGLGERPRLQLDKPEVLHLARATAVTLARTVLPVMLLMAASAVALNVLQVGFLISPEALQFRPSAINPLQGAQRILSVQAVAKLGMSLGKLAAVVTVAGLFIAGALPQVLLLAELPWETVETPPGAAQTGSPPEDDAFREFRVGPLVFGGIRHATVRLAFQMAGVLVVLGVLDWGVQRWKHNRELRMTKQEIRDEMKQLEGDPRTRQRRREIHQKLAAARDLHRVQTADVVVTNPTHLSVAVKYAPESGRAPFIVAKGAGEVALQIREIARRHNIPVVERKPLAQALYRDVRVGQEIPLEMYQVFIDILAYVYRLTGRRFESPIATRQAPPKST